MDSKRFTYPLIVQWSRQIIIFTAILPVILIPLLLISNDFKSVSEFTAAIVSPLFMTLSSVLYQGAWADLETDDEGIYIQFLWKKLYVPWDNLVDVKDFGVSLARTTIVLVNKNRLTWFHRIYSVFTVGSFLPGFHIYPQLTHSKELLHIINRHIANKSKIK